jgi:4-amino-4-deoxy-L-arabinose transferase-like glycosyltransferase
MGRERYGLAAVMIGAFLLRVWHLSSGVPFAVGIDEPFVMSTAMRILHSGDFNPHFFDYPTLYIYTQVGVSIVVYMIGAMHRSWSALAHFGAADVYLWARLVTVAFGTGTVWLVYRVGRSWGSREALLAAAVMAVAPMHVRESHYVLTDVPMTFFVTLTLLLSKRAVDAPGPAAFCWAGVAAGLAAGTKYNGAYALLMPVAAWAFMPAQRPLLRRSIVPAIAGAAGAFLVVAPYTLLDLPAFLNAWGYLATHYRPRGRFAEPGWLLYLKHLRLSFGWPGSFLCLAGLGILARWLFTGPHRARTALVVVFPFAYFWLIARSSMVFGRYALPLLPFVSLWIGIAVVVAIGYLRGVGLPSRWRTAIVVVLLGALLLPPLWTSVSFLRMIGIRTPQSEAWSWIDRRLMAGTRIVSEAKGLSLPGERYSVQYVESLAGADIATFGNAPVDALIVSSDAWGQAGIDAARAGVLPPSHRHLLSVAKSIQTFRPSPGRQGPTIFVLVLNK